MALVKCRECGKEISDKALACPSCGAPMAVVAEGDSGHSSRAGAKWEGLGFVLIVGGLIWLLGGGHWGGIFMMVGFVLFLVGRLQGKRVQAGGSSLRSPFGVVVIVVAISVVLAMIYSNEPAPPAPPLTPEQIRQQQVQAAADRGEIELMVRIKASMHDPDSFELVGDRYVDAGDHITMVMTYRGKNGFGGVRTERVAATLDLQGNITSMQAVE